MYNKARTRKKRYKDLKVGSLAIIILILSIENPKESIELESIYKSN